MIIDSDRIKILRKSDDRDMDPAEKYGEDSESEDELGNMEQLEIENGLVEISGKNGSRELDISVVQANANYVAAGTEVLEEADRITLANNAHLMNSEVNDILDRIVDKIQMRYTPAEFQRVTLMLLGE